ncbi:TetR/AcrR family transcriptional regulator [Microbacterium sp. NPDC087665]|uniref:TetR/AcrR family transcriptional regulator n=1 Tax=Microbacterium sp. NPDC087665 TaxID=3364194 RepID=UPI00380379A5
MARPRSFDEQVLLDGAQDLFWKNGYERTSIDEIAATAGVGNGSIYSAYKSKLGLFIAVFERYCDSRVALVDEILAGHDGPFEDAVENYLDEIIRDCTAHEDRRGCLMLNSIAELGSRFPEVLAIGARSNARMEDLLVARVASSANSGEIRLGTDGIRPLAAHIVLVSQGIIHLSRTGVAVAKLREVVAAARDLTARLRTA